MSFAADALASSSQAVSIAGSRRKFAGILRQGSGEDPSDNPWLTFDP